MLAPIGLTRSPDRAGETSRLTRWLAAPCEGAAVCCAGLWFAKNHERVPTKRGALASERTSEIGGTGPGRLLRRHGRMGSVTSTELRGRERLENGLLAGAHGRRFDDRNRGGVGSGREQA